MSLKSLIQVMIILIIIIILGSVYFSYFANNSKISLENNEKNIKSEVDAQISKKEEAKILIDNANTIEEKIKSEEPKEVKNSDVKEIKNADVKEIKNADVKEVKNADETTESEEANPKPKKPEINNIVKDIEYLTTDKNGNKYKILATSGRTNSDDKNILDLDNVRGVITSNKRSTVYIVSDFAEYNSSNLKSNFYQNVVINYEDKEITCDYFDVDMKTNIAKAYNNVVVKDPKSTMKAGKIILNIETKVININPDNNRKKVSLTIN